MTEGSDVEPQADAPRAVSEGDSAMLKAFGFDPGIPVYEIERLDFDLDRVKRALFESTYLKPVSLTFYVGSRDPMDIGPGVELFMVVELVQASYAPYAPNLGQTTPIGCFDTPNWYLRGFVYKSGFDPYQEVIRMHAYIVTGGSEEDFDHALVQVVRPPSGASPDTPMVRGDGIPGQG